jgi:hypothetical protein
VQTQVAKQLAAEAQQPTPAVSCPGGLAAKVGATVDCRLTPKGSTITFPVHVTVTSIKNGTARFSAQVGQAAGAGDKVAFCRDNAKLIQATAGARQASDLVPIFKANQSLLKEFQAKAPSAIVSHARPSPLGMPAHSAARKLLPPARRSTPTAARTLTDRPAAPAESIGSDRAEAHVAPPCRAGR